MTTDSSTRPECKAEDAKARSDTCFTKSEPEPKEFPKLDINPAPNVSQNPNNYVTLVPQASHMTIHGSYRKDTRLNARRSLADITG